MTLSLKQADGTRFLAQPFGDEWYHGLKTLDGYIIMFDEKTKNWVYTQLGPDGTLLKSELIVGKSIPHGIKNIPLELRKYPKRKYKYSPWGLSLSNSSRRAPGAPITGVHKLLIILVEFDPDPSISGEAGERFSVGTTAADWSNKIFGETASVKDYYREVSYGQLILEPAQESHEVLDGIVGWLRLPRKHPNVQDISEENLQLTREAIIAADPYVNFAAFDANVDGYISTQELNIIIIVAGYETAYGGPGAACSPSIWAHSMALDETDLAPIVDGVKVADFTGGGGYIQIGEWHCYSLDNPGHPATIGVIAHELAHDLGDAPDLYDIDDSSAGIGDWGLMGSGSWNTLIFAGDTPAHMIAWTKWYMGWITPKRVTSPLLNEPIAQVEFNKDSVYQLLDNPGGVDWNRALGSGEYFLIENRQKAGYDAALPGEGLLIWHVDESQPNNANVSHKLVDLEEADGIQNMDCASCNNYNQGDAGDPFPGTTLNRAFTNSSNPNSKLNNGLSSGVSVLNISDSGPVMTADLAVGSPDNHPPQADAGMNQTVKVGATVKLDGSKSSDPDGDQLSFKWTFIATPPGSRHRPGDKLLGPTPSFVPDMPGDYILELTVDDGWGGSSSAQVTITAEAEVLFSSDLEAGTDGWKASGEWHWANNITCVAPQPGYSSPTHAWHFGGEGPDGRCRYSGSGTLLSPVIPINGATRVMLSFHYFLQLSDRRDRAEVRVSFNGGRRWKRVWSGRRAPQGIWTQEEVSIKLPKRASEIQLQFVLLKRKNSSGEAAGWLVDDINIISVAFSARGSSGVGEEPDLKSAELKVKSIQSLPNPAGLHTRFTVEGIGIQAIQISIFNLAGKKVFSSGWVNNDNSFSWHLQDDAGQSLANGVYLYIVAVKGWDGSVIRSEVRKLILLR